MADQEIPFPKQVVPLDFDSTLTVPQSHIWPDSEFLSSSINSDEKLSLPLIDLLDDRASELIGRSCEEWGMFQLINHGIPKIVITETEEEARRLFSLPTRQKMKTLQVPGMPGYGMAGISKYYSKSMWHEGFSIKGSPIDNAKKLWPSDYKRFCDAMEEYQRKMKDLGDKIMRLIFKFLDISEEEIIKLIMFTPNNSTKNYTALRLNSYPPCPDPDRVIGMTAHTDTSLLTILHQARNDGLQIFKDKTGNWVPLSPTSGSLIVNVGDLLHILSNGRFLNVLHRVMIQGKTEHRLSLAYLYNPPPDMYISPYCKPLSLSPQFPLYRSVTMTEFLSIKHKNNGNAFSTIKIST